MKITIDVEKAVAEFRKTLLRLAEGEKPPRNNAKPFVDYNWDESDSYKNTSYIMPPSYLTGKILTIQVNDSHFQYRRIWRTNNRELWYGPSKNAFKGDCTILVVGKNAERYKAIIKKGANKEKGWYRGKTNGKRGTWYFNKKMNEYPRDIKITFVGWKTLHVQNTGKAIRTPDGFVFKQSDVRHKLVILAPKVCNSTKCIIEF